MNEPELVKSARKIVKECNAVCIDINTHAISNTTACDAVEAHERGDDVAENITILDMTTANMIVNVWEALNDENKELWLAKLTNKNVIRVIKALWSSVK